MRLQRLIHMACAFTLAFMPLASTGIAYQPSPFVGIWRAIDQEDESLIRAAIWGPVFGRFFVTWSESYFTFCDGPYGLGIGTGSLDPEDPNILEVDMRLGCFRTGATLRWHQTWQYRQDYDVLASLGDYDVETIWSRFPRPLVPRMGLRVNYGHDWVESFYEGGHTVRVTVTGADRDLDNAKATIEEQTEAKDYWDGEAGFQTLDGVWDPETPDIQPGDWVFAQVDNGATAQVQLGDIQGEVFPFGHVSDVADSITGTVLAPWLEEPVPVECLDWGSGLEEPVNKDDGVIATDGLEFYYCEWDQDAEWDVEPWQDIGVGYSTPDGHWVANAFHAEHWTTLWVHDLESGFWSVGEHSYRFEWSYSVSEPGSIPMEDRALIVSSDAPTYDGYVLIGPWIDRPLQAWTGTTCEVVPAINPAQRTRLVWSWVNDFSMTFDEAVAHFDSFVVEAFWDGELDGSATMARGDGLVQFFNREARWDYMCDFTDHP